jgi:hypothetical protein
MTGQPVDQEIESFNLKHEATTAQVQLKILAAVSGQLARRINKFIKKIKISEKTI